VTSAAGGVLRTRNGFADDEPAPSWPSGPQRTQAPARPGGGGVLGAVLVALLVLAAGAVGVFGSRWWGGDDGRRAAPGPAGSAPAAGPAPTGVAVAAFSPRVCDAPGPTDLPVTPARGAVRTAPNGFAMYPDWSFHQTADFGVAVPDGWSFRKVGTTWCFRDPDGQRVLSVDPGRRAGGDPVQACRNEERTLTEAGLLPEYVRVELAPVTYFDRAAADWEYRHRNAGGTALHTSVRWFSVGDRAYAVGWVTREFDWTASLNYLNMIRASFSPGAA
jgi:hypothetical protein